MALSTIQVAGVLGTGLAVAGYLAGMLVAYPGRELSLVLAMLAITLLALGGAGDVP